MNVMTPIRLGATLLRHPGALLGRRRYLFVISHMRSCSSLLCHILGSHPEIDGYSEIQQHYRSRLDLLRLRYRVCQATEGRMGGRYVLDKLLHDYVLSDRIVRRPDVRFVYLIRSPEPTLRSILRMERQSGGQNPWAKPEGAVDYYVARLGQIVSLSERRTTPGDLLVSADTLLDDPEKTLSELTAGLGLASPLSREYRSFKYTGVPRHGDPSTMIRSGNVVPHSRDHDTDIPISPDGLSRAKTAYDRCLETLKS